MAYSLPEIKKAKELILAGLYEGNSLKSILDNNKETPDRSMVYRWLNEVNESFDQDFYNNYIRAREDSSDLDADKIEGLNDELRSGAIDAHTARVIADNLKWIAGKKKPKKYGDKMQHETSGTLRIRHEDMSEVELEAELKRLRGNNEKG